MSAVRDEGEFESPAQARQVDEICVRFEAAWKSTSPDGSPPRIEDFLGSSQEGDRSVLLRELLLLEIQYLQMRGEPFLRKEYRARFPEISDEWFADSFAQQPTVVRRPSSQAATPAPSAGSGRKPAPLSAAVRKIRCPHCRSPIGLVDDRSDEMLCPGCGSSFRLRDDLQTSTVSGMKPIGKFQLLERIGRGSFGAVWRARDCQLDRLVALKILHTGHLSSTEDLERFHREARMAAQLRHPGIVTIHEVTDLEGLPTIVSEFVEGTTLKEFLEVRRLTFAETTEFLAQVAEALHYAHVVAKGLVHRDIKPANIMVEYPSTGELAKAAGSKGAGSKGERPAVGGSALGKARILDFGLASRPETEICMTLDGQIIGTPAYMSPEQAAGKGHQADCRSDVYSLGVVLYELLTGELPFRGSRAMLRHQLLFEEPRPPRRLNDKIPRDLETICLKCMAKEPSRRYRNAGDLAEDLRLHQRNEPIRARPVGAAERAWRWSRRNPRVAILAGALLTTLLAVAVGSTIFAFLFNEETRRAEQNASRANEHLARTLEAVDLLTAVLDQTLKEVPAIVERQQANLKKIQPVLERLLEEHPTQPEMRMQMASALYRVGKLQGSIRLSPAESTVDAEVAFRRALEEFDGLAKQDPRNVSYRLSLGSCRNDFGELLRSTKIAAARKEYDASLECLRQLVRDEPTQPYAPQELARALNNSAIFRLESGEIRPALASFREAIVVLEEVQRKFPEIRAYQADLSRVSINLGKALEDDNEPNPAEKCYRRAIALLEHWRKEFPTGPETNLKLASANQNLGLLLDDEPVFVVQEEMEAVLVGMFGVVDAPRMAERSLRQLRRQEAETRLLEAVELLQRIKTDFPGYHLYEARFAVALHNLGLHYRKCGKLEEARRRWRDALKIAEVPAALAGRHEYKMHLAKVQNSLARDAYEAGSYDEALRQFRDAASQMEAALQLSNSNLQYKDFLGDLYHNLAFALVRKGNHAQTREVMELRLRLFPENQDKTFQSARVFAKFAELSASDAGQADLYANRSLDLLQQLVDQGFRGKDVKVDRSFASLRGRPRFESLARQLADAKKSV